MIELDRRISTAIKFDRCRSHYERSSIGRLLLGVCQAIPKNLNEQWAAIESAIKKGLPKTAIEKLDPLIEEALKDESHAVAIHAICQKIYLEATILGNKHEEIISRLEEEISEVPEALKPIMHAVLSNCYWGYLSQNRWRFTRRTQTAEVTG